MTQDNDYDGPLDDDLINRLVPDADQPDLNPLAGVFVGTGSTKNSIRVYTTLNLNQFFEVPRDKVLGVKRFPSGRVVVWVPTDVRVQLVSKDAVAGDFLKGNLQARAGRTSVGSSGFGRLLSRMGVGPDGGGTSWGGCPSDFADPGGDPTCSLIGCPQPQPTGCSC